MLNSVDLQGLFVLKSLVAFIALESLIYLFLMILKVFGQGTAFDKLCALLYATFSKLLLS